MPEPRPQCIIDANIIIDLFVGNLLDALFEMPFQVTAPDSIVAEMDNPDGQAVVEKGLKSHALSAEQLLEVRALAANYPNISMEDRQAFVLARDLNITLLTGDSRLRELAESAGVNVHGTLWVLDEMVDLGILAPAEAAEGLRLMMTSDRRLPDAECRQRLRNWGQK